MSLSQIRLLLNNFQGPSEFKIGLFSTVQSSRDFSNKSPHVKPQSEPSSLTTATSAFAAYARWSILFSAPSRKRSSASAKKTYSPRAYSDTNTGISTPFAGFVAVTPSRRTPVLSLLSSLRSKSDFRAASSRYAPVPSVEPSSTAMTSMRYVPLSWFTIESMRVLQWGIVL